MIRVAGSRKSLEEELILVALAFHPGDVEATKQLLDWIKLLDRKVPHQILLLADAATQYSIVQDLLKLSKDIFESASLIVTSRPYKGWPSAANTCFLTLSKHIQNNFKTPFLWLEPDATPMKPGWLDLIEKEYKKCGKPFLGAITPVTQPGFPPAYLNGVAVYPANAFDIIMPLVKDRAWDISMADVVVPQAHNSHLFVHLWGQADRPPTFGEIADSMHPERKTLNCIPPGCVLYHRCKDLSLVRLLKKKMFPRVPEDKLFMVVWPFFNGDAKMALKNLQWMAKLGTLRTHDILLSYELGTSQSWIGQMKHWAAQSFASVSETVYNPPMRGDWPPTIAWQHAAVTMQKLGRAWAWLESDAIPLSRDWLTVLQERYDKCRQPFCGPIVPGPGHCNGTAIYPADTPAMLPNTMRTRTPAWDVVMKPEMIHRCHDMSDIFCHRWGEVNGSLHPSEGPPPRFETVEKVNRLIPKPAVIFHRDKSGTLIDRLTEMLATK